MVSPIESKTIPPLDPLAQHILTLSGKIDILRERLNKISAANGVKTPAELDAILPSLEGVTLGLGGKPEALLRKLGFGAM